MRAAELYAKIAELTQRGAPFVVATITDVSGSSPRGVGTKMIVVGNGTTIETIGCGAAPERSAAAKPAAR